MTPAIRAAEHARVEFEVLAYEHDTTTRAYGPEAAAAVGLPPHAVFKTLVVRVAGRGLVVALVTVDRELNLKSPAVAAGGKRAEMADAAEAERATGYIMASRRRRSSAGHGERATSDSTCPRPSPLWGWGAERAMPGASYGDRRAMRTRPRPPRPTPASPDPTRVASSSGRSR